MLVVAGTLSLANAEWNRLGVVVALLAGLSGLGGCDGFEERLRESHGLEGGAWL